MEDYEISIRKKTADLLLGQAIKYINDNVDDTMKVVTSLANGIEDATMSVVRMCGSGGGWMETLLIQSQFMNAKTQFFESIKYYIVADLILFTEGDTPFYIEDQIKDIENARPDYLNKLEKEKRVYNNIMKNILESSHTNGGLENLTIEKVYSGIRSVIDNKVDYKELMTQRLEDDNKCIFRVVNNEEEMDEFIKKVAGSNKEFKKLNKYLRKRKISSKDILTDYMRHIQPGLDLLLNFYKKKVDFEAEAIFTE